MRDGGEERESLENDRDLNQSDSDSEDGKVDATAGAKITSQANQNRRSMQTMKPIHGIPNTAWHLTSH